MNSVLAQLHFGISEPMIAHLHSGVYGSRIAHFFIEQENQAFFICGMGYRDRNCFNSKTSQSHMSRDVAALSRVRVPSCGDSR
jgi:hypothetical protein